MNNNAARVLLGALVLLAGLLPAAPVSAGSQEGRNTVDPSSPVITEPVCLVVHNPGDPVGRHVIGTRYRTGPVTSDREAIILVHGATLRDFWDLRQDFSVARNLARAGYVVIAYDQLGFGDSPYDRPQGGRAITLEASRVMLHEVVSAVKAGHYGIAGNCSPDDGSVAEAGSTKVVLIGHSGGGAIVSGYPGEYHDVAAVVQAAWSNHGFNPQSVEPGNWLWNWTRQFATGRDHLLLFLDDQGQLNRNQCEALTLHPEGVDPDIREGFCDDAHMRTIGAPAGWFTTVASIDAENQAFLRRVGPGLPVLIAWPEFDWVFRAEDRQAENQDWTEHCGCDVTIWTQPGAGHAFQAHRSMPAFTDEVATWLHARGL